MNEWRGLKGRVVKLEDVLAKKLSPVLEPLAPSEWDAIIQRGEHESDKVNAIKDDPKEITRLKRCAVPRHGLSVGESPTRQLSLWPVAIRALVEVTKPAKPLV